MTQNDAHDDQALAARRFRAIASIPGAEMHGSGGIDAEKGRPRDERHPGCCHFGALLSSGDTDQKGNPWGPNTVAWARGAIMAIVVDRMLVEGLVPDPAPIGASETIDAARWAALIRIPRIRVMEHRDGPDGVSLRAEWWTSGEPHRSGQDDPTEARLIIAKIADDIIARKGSPAAPAPAPRSQIDLASASFRRVNDMEIAIDGVRADGSTVLVGTVDPEFAGIAREIAEAMEALGVRVDRADMPDPEGDEPIISFATMRISTGADGSDWTDLETRSSEGKFPSASVAEEFDPVLERVAALHPFPDRKPA